MCFSRSNAPVSYTHLNQNIVAGFQAENPDIKVEIVPVDFDNAEQVIKTGIASGDPVDVSFFWGSQINAFTEDNMAYDLTPYLTAVSYTHLDVYKRQVQNRYPPVRRIWPREPQNRLLP